MCDCASTSSCSCDGLTIPSGRRGIQGIPGPPPGMAFDIDTLPAGSDAQLDVTGGPLSYTLTFGIPRGDTGAGVNAYTTTTAPFDMPALDGTVTVSVLNSTWPSPGQPVYIQGAGTMQFISAPSATTATVRNPSTVWGFGVGTGIPGNATPGTTIATGSGFSAVGRPALPGAQGPQGEDGPSGTNGTNGTPGADGLILVQTTIPTVAPAPGREVVIVTDSPTTPTYTRMYSWNGAAWAQAANIQGADGTLITNTPGDPNSTLPAGPIGTIAIRTDVLSLYTKTGASTWTLTGQLTPTFTQVATQSGGDFGTVAVATQSVVGYVPFSDVHSAPGTYTLDLQYQSIVLAADKNITFLDWDDTAYTDNAIWTLAITNVDGSSISIGYQTSRWSKATGITEPTTLAAAATQLFTMTRVGTRMMITATAVVANI